MKLFNSAANISTPKYHVVIGNIKMKEGYNILACNNVFILALPYNITNYIQVLGRCSRNKSHIGLPASFNYVNTYLLVNSSESTETYDKQAFIDLKRHQEKSEYFGKITREEFDVWEKNQDF